LERWRGTRPYILCGSLDICDILGTKGKRWGPFAGLTYSLMKTRLRKSLWAGPRMRKMKTRVTRMGKTRQKGTPGRGVRPKTGKPCLI
jgi:hypothetical protein